MQGTPLLLFLKQPLKGRAFLIIIFLPFAPVQHTETCLNAFKALLWSPLMNSPSGFFRVQHSHIHHPTVSQDSLHT